MDISLFKNKDPLLFLEVFENAVKSIRKGAVDWNYPNEGQPKLRNMDDTTGWLTTKSGVSSITMELVPKHQGSVLAW